MHAHGKIWVLIVDDDTDASEILADLLAREGIDAMTAANGAEAIHIVDSEADHPSVIITDLLMPGVVGMSFLDYLRSDPELASIPVAVMTSAPHLAPDGYLVFKKPFDVAAVVHFLHATAIGADPLHARPRSAERR
jgi:CheY-like chemotaxis protein